MKRAKTVWVVVNVEPGYWIYAMNNTRKGSIEEFCTVPGPLKWSKATAKGWRCVKAKITYEVTP